MSMTIDAHIGLLKVLTEKVSKRDAIVNKTTNEKKEKKEKPATSDHDKPKKFCDYILFYRANREDAI